VSNATVLIVHDDATFLEGARSALIDAMPSAEVLGAVSGPRALGIARQRRPDVIVADGELEGMDGYALTIELKRDPDLAAIPVMIVTGEPTEATATRARQAGAVAHLPTSVESGTLAGTVLRVLGRESAVPRPRQSPASEDPADAGPLGTGPAQQARAGGFAHVASAPPTTPVVTPAVADQRPRSQSDLPSVDRLLRMTIEMGGSDLHITAGSPPGIRIRGNIEGVEGARMLMPQDTRDLLLPLLDEEQKQRFSEELELDFAYSIPGLSRFRTNIFRQRNSIGGVFRAIPLKIPTIDELGLPKVCTRLADRPRGLVLVTGPTGSGKSTTLAAMIDHINSTRPVHIMTMEDPIEFVHRNKKAYVNQREIGGDTHSFASALKRVLRQDPDVILVGEMRDLETISAALTAAETGHLVLATLHTTGGPETVDRIIDVFPPYQQQQVRMQLSTSLEGVLSQTLLRGADGKSRVMAMEIMLGVPAISNLIREGKTHQMPTIIQGGSAVGMQTLDQHLKVLLQAGLITYEEAIQKSKEPTELAQMMGRTA